jgi:hypothetical protein
LCLAAMVSLWRAGFKGRFVRGPMISHITIQTVPAGGLWTSVKLPKHIPDALLKTRTRSSRHAMCYPPSCDINAGRHAAKCAHTRVRHGNPATAPLAVARTA